MDITTISLMSALPCATFIAGIFDSYPLDLYLKAKADRKRLFEFAETVHMAVVSADVGMGKTLLFSILADNLGKGCKKKISFVSNARGCELLSYKDLNWYEKIPRSESYRIPKYFFLDETNFYMDGVEYQNNRKYHKGVAQYLQIIRHHKAKLWISATRDNHVWVAIRKIVNYHVRLGGLEKLFTLFGMKYFTLKVDFYKQSGELKESFNILISEIDFNLYDSYWLKDTSYFRIKDE